MYEGKRENATRLTTAQLLCVWEVVAVQGTVGYHGLGGRVTKLVLPRGRARTAVWPHQTAEMVRHNTYLVFPTKQTKPAPRQRQAA